MPVDTRIDGDPADILRAEHWIRTTLGPTIERTADDAARARRVADDAWDGDASDAFLERTSTYVRLIDDLHDRTRSAAETFATLAAELSRARGDMGDIRERAAQGGLPLEGFVIDASPAGTEETAILYQDLGVAADAVHARWSVAVATATNTWIGHPWAATFLAGTALDYLDTDLKNRVQTIRTNMETLRGHSIRAMEDALAVPRGAPYDEFRSAYGRAADRIETLADTARRYDDLGSLSRTVGRVVGPLGLVAGVGLDYVAGGESFEQAVVSNAAGLGASVLAGAAAGAVAGSFIPFGGTALGAAVGATFGTLAGIFTSGGVDNIYESGTVGLGQFTEAGIGEVLDARDAAAELGRAALDGISDLGERALRAVF